MNSDMECANIVITDDSALEDNQILFLVLTTSDPDVIIGGNTTTITIEDNDG